MALNADFQKEEQEKQEVLPKQSIDLNTSIEDELGLDFELSDKAKDSSSGGGNNNDKVSDTDDVIANSNDGGISSDDIKISDNSSSGVGNNNLVQDDIAVDNNDNDNDYDDEIHTPKRSSMDNLFPKDKIMNGFVATGAFLGMAGKNIGEKIQQINESETMGKVKTNTKAGWENTRKSIVDFKDSEQVKTFKENVSQTGKTIGETTGNAMNNHVKPTLSNVGQSIATGFQATTHVIGEKTKPVVTSISEKTAPVVNSIKEKTAPVITDLGERTKPARERTSIVLQETTASVGQWGSNTFRRLSENLKGKGGGQDNKNGESGDNGGGSSSST